MKGSINNAGNGWKHSSTYVTIDVKTLIQGYHLQYAKLDVKRSFVK
jgi:hypothetical protein